MNIDKRTVGPVRVVELTGTLDADAAQKAEPELVAEAIGARFLLVDLGGVRGLSSAGLRLLLLLYREVNSQRGRFAVSGLSEEARDVMGAAGYLDSMNTFDSAEAGLAALSQQEG